MKSEPEELSYSMLVKKKRAGWDGVRNHQAKNFLRRMVAGGLPARRIAFDGMCRFRG